MARTFLDEFGMTDEMRRRWRHVRTFTAAGRTIQGPSGDEIGGDYRPVGRVFVTRGVMQRRITDPNGPVVGVEWRAEWDEKYRWGLMPGQQSEAGSVRDEMFRDPVELPHVKSIQVDNGIDSGGISTASVTMANIKHEENVGIDGFIYHVLQEAFFSPFRNGDENFGKVSNRYTEIDHTDLDLFLGRPAPSNMTLDEDGKAITGLLMPNRRIEIFQGYGDEVQRTYTGLIDTVSVNAKTGELSITSSDFGRVLAETTYNQQSVPPGRYPVAFIDWLWVREVARTSWVRRFNILKTSLPVEDISHIVGRICGWAGFQYWNRVRAGRIGKTGIGYTKVDGVKRPNRAVFTGENFEKGNYFMDGVNQIKNLLGYLFFITPDIHPDSPVAGRITDPNVYDDEYSSHLIGMPNFVPPNVWNMNPSNQVEQFLEDEVVLNGGVVYDHSVIKKQIFVSNTGKKSRNGRPRTFGYTTPFELDHGLINPIYLNFGEEYGSVKMSSKEIQILMRVIMLRALLQFNRGSFTVAGWPGATLNKQVDILESKSGTWRRFYVTSFSHSMELGENASWTTDVEVINLDNIYIRRIKRQIKKLMGVDQDIDYDLTHSKPPKAIRTPAWINKPQRGSGQT